MEKKKTKTLMAILVSAIVFIVAWSISKETIVFPILAAVLVGIVILSMLKTRNKKIIEDERNYKISETASRRTIQVVGITTATAGLGIILLSNQGFLDLANVGYSLAYVACGLLITYMIFYRYYARKYGD